jgi:hypothetical protein
MDRAWPAESSAGELLRRLQTPIPTRTWGPIFSGVVAWISVGLLPLWFWPRRWNALAETERLDMLALATWWRRRAAPEDAQHLDTAARRLGPQPILMIVPLLILAFIGVLMMALFMDGWSIGQVRELTYGYHPYFLRPFWRPLSPAAVHLHSIWMIGLIVAYGCQWIAVRSRVFAMQALVASINRVADGSGARAVSPPVACSGLRPLWVGVAIVFCMMHAWWGIPLVLAGAMQRRYMTVTSPRVHRGLADQLRGIISPSAEESSAARFCRGERCRAWLPADAKFCPRCGLAVDGDRPGN